MESVSERADAQYTEEMIVADLFCDQLKSDVENSVHRKVENTVVGEVITKLGISSGI